MSECSDRFITAAFAISTCQALAEQLWLRREGFAPFIKTEMQGPLADLKFLEPLLEDPTKQGLKALVQNARLQQEQALIEIARFEADAFHAFAAAALHEMARLSRKAWPEYMANGIYRAFDIMDEAFGFDYQRDQGMKAHVHERLYEGAGVGVQTSYTTLIAVLAQMGVQNQHVIDLGSGYGRLGLVLGLLYPQAKFTGYEFVAHRVEAATTCARKAGVDQRVKFITQDLSDLQFQIPVADIYYLYDPFTQQTYKQVLRQLIVTGRTRPLIVAAKAAARDRFQLALQDEPGWDPLPQMCDSNTLALFRSQSGSFKTCVAKAQPLSDTVNLSSSP